MRATHHLIIYPNAAYARAFGPLSCTCNVHACARVRVRACACEKMEVALLRGFWYLHIAAPLSQNWLFQKENVSWECSFYTFSCHHLNLVPPLPLAMPLLICVLNVLSLLLIPLFLSPAAYV